ncbi:unnamed protein product [Allacma fusca]|uniref:Gustatory receptor n=1 Tax=Allacma fusca TaxID=39272 RepID=A0A8J2KUU2_9HEXA|nr:unnamed protein product [Allacma fusca]
MCDLRDTQNFAYPLKIIPYLLNSSNGLLCNPYFIRHDRNSEKYEVISCLVQKVSVAVLHILSISLLSLKVIAAFNRKETGIVLLLLIALYATWLAFNTSVIYVLWFKQHRLVQFLNLGKNVCNQVALVGYPPRRIVAFTIAIALPLMLFGWTIVDILRTKRVYASYAGLRTNIFEISAEIFYQDLRNSFQTANRTYAFSGNFTRLDYVVGFLYQIALFETSVILHLGFALCMSVSFVCWFIVKDFLTCVKTSYGLENLTMVLDIIDDLHDIFESCSASMGFIFCEVSLLYVPMYAVHLPTIASEDIIDVIELALFVCCVFLSVMPAGDVHSMIKSIPPIIQRWFQDAGKVLQDRQIDFFRCNIALQNINANHFGLGAKLFTLTNGTIGGVVVGSIHVLVFLLLSIKVVAAFNRQGIEIQSWLLVGLYASWLLFNASVIRLLWFKQSSIANFLNAATEVCDQVGFHSALRRKRWAFIIAITLPTLVLAWSTFEMFRIFQSYDGFSLNIFEIGTDLLKEDLRNAFSKEKNQSSVLNNPIFRDNYRIWETVIGLTYELVIFENSLILHFGFAVCISFSLVCWFIVTDFVTCLRTSYGNRDLTKVLDVLDNLYEVFQCCSDYAGFVYCEVALMYVPMYAVHLPTIASQDIIEIIELLLVISAATLSVLPAADVHAMIKSIPTKFQTWLKETVQGLQEHKKDSLRCIIVLQNINANHFGLDAKLFTLTYGTLGGILGLTITCAFVVAPMKFNPALDLVR